MADRKRSELTQDQQIAFDWFWAQYPRHIARADAKRAWLQLDPDADVLRDIRKALMWQFLDTEQEFIPYPATWLRGERWEDEPPETPVYKGPQDYIDPDAELMERCRQLRQWRPGWTNEQIVEEAERQMGVG